MMKIAKLTPSIQIANEKREVEYTLDFEEAVNMYELAVSFRTIAVVYVPLFSH